MRVAVRVVRGGVCAVAVVLASAAPAAGESRDASAFAAWRALATDAPLSPETAAPGDLVRSWTAPDGRTVRLVVHLPRPAPGAPSVTMGAVAAGADATPVFAAAIAAVRRLHAGRLVIPPGVYTFRTLAPAGDGQAVVDRVSDLTIAGTGATFVFTLDKTGLLIARAKRIRLVGLTLRSALPTASFARVGSRDGDAVLVPDGSPLSGPVVSVVAFDRASGTFVPGGARLLFPPGARDAPKTGDGVVRSPRFAALPAGATVVLYHQWYGGNAIRAGAPRGPDQTEDVSIEGVRIESSPGMAILAYGVARGFAVTDTTIAPADAATDPLGSEWDGIHVEASGGDIVLARDTIERTGDDGINLNDPVFPIRSRDGTALVLGAWSRFVAQGDVLALFDAGDRYLGHDTAASVTPLGGLLNRVALFHPEAAAGAAIVRDMALVGRRVLVENDTVADCNCHGLLVQDPDVLVQGNHFTGLARNAIRLLTSTGLFKEGAGAFDVAVRNNVVDDTGPDTLPGFPWAAITAYAMTAPLRLADHPENADLLIDGNDIHDTADGCIAIADSVSVSVRGNRCDDTGRQQPGVAPIRVLRSGGVTLATNRANGVAIP